jgi:hypothetical protein
MKYIISEGKLEKVLMKFLKEKDFVEDVIFQDDEVHIWLKYRIPPKESENLAHQIVTMFNYHGEIYKPSITQGYYIPIARF